MPTKKTPRPSRGSAKQKHFAAVIRHGERGDRVEGFEYPQHKFDAPLTPTGMTQGKATGQYLNEYFKKNKFKFDKIIVESSPFLRCMMTAGQIAPEIGTKSVTINYQASEQQVEQYSRDGELFPYFTENPMPLLEYTKHGFDFKRM